LLFQKGINYFIMIHYKKNIQVIKNIILKCYNIIFLKNIKYDHLLIFCIFFQIFFCVFDSKADNPWIELQREYNTNKTNKSVLINKKNKINKNIDKQSFFYNDSIIKSNINNDPWLKLRNKYLPFTIEDDKKALNNKKARKKIYTYFSDSLDAYETIIMECSQLFNIPDELIKAVIMVESSADPRAKAKTSSAKGLMQTIDSTFLQAKNGLFNKGIIIKNDPFNPRSSIYAGSWYLNKMFKIASKNNNKILDRNHINDWKYALQYYYAGPEKGKIKKNIVFFYQKGKIIYVNKKNYSDKVIKWAKIIQKGV